MSRARDARVPPASISLAMLRELLAAREPMVLVDVREEDELGAGVIPGAVWIPHGVLPREAPAKLPDRSARIVAYCAGGSRAALAARTLAALGYVRVEAANPGFVRWKELGYAVEQRQLELHRHDPQRLTAAQRQRYARHIALRQVGEAGQARLLTSRVLVVGLGGLGSPAALYLAAAGVGTLGLVDSDTVEASNLQRQVIHAESRIGMPKVESARRVIADLNPDVAVVGHALRLGRENVEELFAAYDVVVDCTDNFPARYLVSDAGVRTGTPVVHASIFRFEGQATTFLPDRAAARLGIAGGPCYRCLYPVPPPADLGPTCQETGVLGVLPGILGVVQATEAIKLLLGQGAPLVGRLLTYDSLEMRFREMRLPRDPSCPACGSHPTLASTTDYEAFCAGR